MASFFLSFALSAQRIKPNNDKTARKLESVLKTLGKRLKVKVAQGLRNVLSASRRSRLRVVVSLANESWRDCANCRETCRKHSLPNRPSDPLPSSAPAPQRLQGNRQRRSLRGLRRRNAKKAVCRALLCVALLQAFGL